MRNGWLVLIVSAAAMLARPAIGAVPAAERDALIQFFHATHGENWIARTGWCANDICGASNDDSYFSASGTECGWFGIRCSASSDHVAEIVLVSNNLSGELSTELVALCSLETLNLSHNRLQGAFPSICPSSVKTLIIRDNFLTGPIPDLSGFQSLITFVASNNLLTGYLLGLDHLSSLQKVDIQNNRVEGVLPPLSPTLGGTDLVNLEQFLVAHNHFVGTIPNLAGLDNLSLLDIGDNSLSGSVPAAPETLVAIGLANLCPNQLFYPVADATIDAEWTDIYAYREEVPSGTPWWYQCDVIFADGFLEN